MANNSRYLEAVALHLATRLHRSSTGYRCRCGQCRHIILTSARRAGLDPRRLVAALPPERPVKREERRPRRSVMTTQVSSSMTVLRGRHQYQGPEAVLALLGSN